jgi:hypothetical protein
VPHRSGLPVVRPAGDFNMPISRFTVRAVFATTAVLLTATLPARAEQPSPEARIVVIGEGSVTAAPDYASIRSGVTMRAKTAKDATDATSKAMTAMIAALTAAGIQQKDIQTSRLSLNPVYESPEPRSPAKLTGYSAANQVVITIRQLDKVGDILDHLIAAGATDAGSIEFLHNDLSKTLDRAREAAVADARRKAELYAHAAGQNLGAVAFITEDSNIAPPLFKTVRALAAPGMLAGAPPPVSVGEDKLRVSITVGFDLAR